MKSAGSQPDIKIACYLRWPDRWPDIVALKVLSILMVSQIFVESGVPAVGFVDDSPPTSPLFPTRDRLLDPQTQPVRDRRG